MHYIIILLCNCLIIILATYKKYIFILFVLQTHNVIIYNDGFVIIGNGK
jgi:hypothetical protein